MWLSKSFENDKASLTKRETLCLSVQLNLSIWFVYFLMVQYWCCPTGITGL